MAGQHEWTQEEREAKSALVKKQWAERKGAEKLATTIQTAVNTPTEIEFTDEEIARATQVLAEVARRKQLAEAAKAQSDKEVLIETYEKQKQAIKDYIKKGFDNPGWLSRELKIPVTHVEAIRRVITREIEADREKEFLKIPGIPQ